MNQEKSGIFSVLSVSAPVERNEDIICICPVLSWNTKKMHGIWNKEPERLKNYPSAEYTDYYGVSGFDGYELLAIRADDYYGFVCALVDHDSQYIACVEIIFCNYFMDFDYEKYIPVQYLAEGFDASAGNTYRLENLK